MTRLDGNFVSNLGLVADKMDALAETGLCGREKTAAELRADIERKIAALGVNFIVVIDDLDRLEPAHVLEVLQMVRSVADFSRFYYVLYWRMRLNQAFMCRTASFICIFFAQKCCDCVIYLRFYFQSVSVGNFNYISFQEWVLFHDYCVT